MLENIDLHEIMVIDVRTPGEYAGGHIEESINIPLNEIESRLEEIKHYNKAMLLCCASGMRSGQACSFLQQNGVKNVYNGGSWSILQYQLNDNKQLK